MKLNSNQLVGLKSPTLCATERPTRKLSRSDLMPWSPASCPIETVTVTFTDLRPLTTQSPHYVHDLWYLTFIGRPYVVVTSLTIQTDRLDTVPRPSGYLPTPCARVYYGSSGVCHQMARAHSITWRTMAWMTVAAICILGKSSATAKELIQHTVVIRQLLW